MLNRIVFLKLLMASRCTTWPTSWPMMKANSSSLWAKRSMPWVTYT